MKKHVNPNTFLLLVVIVLSAITLLTRASEPAETELARGGLSPTAVPGRTRTPTPSATVSSTPDSTVTPTAEVTPTVGVTPSPPPPTGVNLLVNGSFYGSLAPWLVDCENCWFQAHKLNTPSLNHTSAECDQDLSGAGVIHGWEIGTEGRLWQDVNPPGDHEALIFSLAEVQHHGQNEAAWHIYGSNGTEWTELWARTEFGDDVPYNGLANRSTWYWNTYTVTVPIQYEQYRVEAYCHVTACLAEDQDCGWKFTALELRAD